MSWQSFWNGVKNVFTGNVPSKYNGVDTDIGSEILGALGFQNDGVKNADFARSELSADNQLQRDKQLMEMNNQFNAEQAQIGREWQAQREDTYYQRMVEDMKNAGINPIMAISGGGADVGSTPTASSSSARSSGSNYSGSSAGNNIVGAITSLLGGLLSTKATNTVRLKTAQIGLEGKKYSADINLTRDNAWRSWYDSKNNYKKRR